MLSQHSSAIGGRRGGLLLLALAAAVAGIIVLVVALTGQQSAPEPPPSAAGTVGDPATSPSSSPDSSPSASPQASSSPNASSGSDDSEAKNPVGFSEPVSISIPAIGVQSEVFSIGKNDDGTLRVPQPGPNLNKAAWYKNSPSPGQIGPSVIEGHVDTAEQGPSIFFDLGDLRPGDKIKVTREDGKTAVYTVDGLRNFPKDEFPTKLVYGGNINEATLRLITCSNFDPSVGTHTGNLIAFSTLTKIVPA